MGTLKTLEEKIRMLPPELRHEVDDFVDFLLMKASQATPTGEEHAFWLGTSQTALGAIWDNDEDDIYAELLPNDIIRVR